MSRFFIEHPIFSSVISIVILIAGTVTLGGLPISQYPEITPPTVEVKAIYPGANAEVIAETVAAPIEQEVNGVEGMIYMSSTSSADGSYVLTISFEVGTDPDLAQILTQNRVKLAEPNLPEEVLRQGVETKKKSTAIILFIVLTSPDGRYDDLFLSNYATLRLRDNISRIPGVGDVKVLPESDYSMRIWLDPDLLKARKLTPKEVVDAIREQNVQVAAGQIGQPPAPPGQSFQFTVNVLGRLSDVEQFKDIIIRAEGQNITRVRDVARVELGSKTYDMLGGLSGQRAAHIAVFQLPGANALDVATKVRAAMEEMSRFFPEGMKYSIPYDTTIFVDESINEVFITLLEAGALVFLVLFIFLQSWRATIIPAVAIPVSLVGTFAVMGMLGFSINMLTLFGMVLAIGVVVDDAIVVVEASFAYIEKGMKPKEAAIQAMRDVTGPVIATTLVLMAVFVPSAFLPGITGQMSRQFAITIAVATAFSSVNALTMSPALCALLLRPPPEKKNPFSRGFDRVFDVLSRGYGGMTRGLVKVWVLMILVFVGGSAFTGWQFGKIPTGFLPTEDQGYFMTVVQLPPAASLERTEEVVARLDDIFARTPGVREWVTQTGFSLLDNTNVSNAATVYVVMDPFDERTTPEVSQEAILAHVNREFAAIQEGLVIAFPPPALIGLGTTGGFEFMLEDRAGVGLRQLQSMTTELIRDGNSQSGLKRLSTNFRSDVPQLFLEVDRQKAKTMGVPLDVLFGSIQAYMGSTYVNDFNKFGRTWQVKVQADHRFRVEAEGFRRLEVRNNDGEMVPVGTLVSVKHVLGPQTVVRYNLYPAAKIIGEPAPGRSSGEAMKIMESMADAKLPTSMGYDWTSMSYQEKQVGNEAIMVYIISIILVFLVLAAQYESWTAPMAVIMVVPLAILGTVMALRWRGLDNNVYTQIGIVLLIGLASKNAILIVEFARAKREEGLGIIESAVEAARQRFRPILMTAISSIAGFSPLLVASGAGAASRQSIGTAVVGGMIAATLMSLGFTPVFYRVMQGLGEFFSRKNPDAKKE